MYGYGQEVSGFDTVLEKLQMSKDKYQISTNAKIQNSRRVLLQMGLEH